MELALASSFVLPFFKRTKSHCWSTDFRASIATLLLATVCLSGCNTESTKRVVAEIAVQIPLAQAVVTTAAATAQGIDPAAALLIATAATAAQLSLAQLQILCNAYAQTQSPEILASIGTALNTLLNTNATALLDAAHIIDPASRVIAQASLGALQTGLLLISVILQRSQSPTQIAATVAMRTYKLSDVAPYLNRESVQQATGIPFNIALQYQEAAGF
jgi:hypothetical protein